MKKWCYDYAVAHVSRYPKTVKQLREFLLRKGYAPDAVETVVERLQAHGILDDTVYARLTLQSEVCRKGKPLSVIEQKLRVKGVDKTILQELQEELAGELEEGMRGRIVRLRERLLARWYDHMKILQNITAKGYPYWLVKEVTGW